MHKIILVDESAIFRETLSAQLNTVEEYAVVGNTGNPSATLSLLDQVNVDLVILDVAIGSYDLLDIIKRLLNKHANLKIIVLSMVRQEHLIKSALAAGIRAYVSKSAKMATLITAIDRVIDGHKYISDEISEILVDALSDDNKQTSHQLSSREEHILKMIGKGVSITKIAEDLKLSPKTISSHKGKIMQKLHLKTNTELIKYYLTSEEKEREYVVDV